VACVWKQGRSQDFWFGELILAEALAKISNRKKKFRLQRALSTGQIKYGNKIGV